AALATAALLMIPVYAWLAMTAAVATDAPTREAFVAVLGTTRAYVAHVVAAAILAACARALVILATVVSGGMAYAPSGPRIVGWLFGEIAALAIGLAIGAVAAPPVVTRRGLRAVLFVGLIALTPIALPVLRLARNLDEKSTAHVLAAVVPAALVCTAAG